MRARVDRRKLVAPPVAPRGAGKGLRGRVAEVLSLDLRSLAVYRVGLSLALLYDLLDRSRDLVALYGDEGVLPAASALEMFGRGIYASIHFHASGSAFALGALFGLGILCAAALLVGYRTRLATVLSWYLLASLQVRNDWANGMSGDVFLVALLFWAIFLPLGARGSADARSGRSAISGNRLFRVATAAHILQLFVMYLSTGLLKSGEAWSDGSALYYALALGHFETPYTELLREQSWALPALTHGARLFEVLAPWLLLVPARVPTMRMAAILLFTGFHLSLALFLNVGPFPLFCLVGWLALLPGAFFDDVLPRLGIGRVAEGAAARGVPAASGIARWADLALLIPLLFVLGQAIVKLGWLDLGYGTALPPAASRFGQLLRLNQNWSMFAPEPSRYTMWLGVEGRLVNGDAIDPFARAPVRSSIPDDIAGSSRSYRWRAYSWTALLTKPSRATLATSHRDFADFLCREWNASHEGQERLESLTSVGFWRQTLASRSQNLSPSVLYEYRCGLGGNLVWPAARQRVGGAPRG